MLYRFLMWLHRIGWAELIYGQAKEGGRTLYLARVPLSPMTRWGQLLWHVFYRGDEDPDPHDHPWRLWTYPFQTYLEEVMEHDGTLRYNRVERWRWHFRDFTYTHRVIGPLDCGSWPLHTLVWRGPYIAGRRWGFWVKGNNPVLDLIGWHIQSNPCTTMTDTDRLSERWRMKVPWRTYIYGEKQKEPM